MSGGTLIMESSHFNGTNHAIQIACNYGPVSADFHQSKRSKTAHYGGLPAPRHDQYTIAWVCALHIEMAAAQTMLDNFHEALPTYADDRNVYVLGNIEEHNVVIACLPTEQYGTNNAAIVMTNLQRTFPAIRACLMVGIGGGVPTRADVRLGDIVVGTRVMQCDLGRILVDGQLQRTAIPRTLDHSLGALVSTVRSRHELGPSRVMSILEQRLREQPAYSRPDLPDRLFDVGYDHEPSSGSCDGCDLSKLVPRGIRTSDEVVIHYGAIASGNQVMRDGKTRDIIARQLDIICFEMEAAGLMDILPCLAIRGICDYSDSHKNKEWQRYAAATAAAYARELLEELPVTRSHAEIASAGNSDQSSVSERRKTLLDSLKFEQMDARKTTIKQEQKKTCRWLLKHPSYEAWLDPAQMEQHHGFLWMSGKPGAGKSTIMKFAYGNMKGKTRQKDAMTASFFFNARGDSLEKTISGMYRSLLLQLLETYPDLQVVLDDPDQVPRNQTGCPSLDVLKALFANAIFALGQRSLVCFVDALDECDEQQVVDMVQYFEDLAEDSTAKGIRFRICFSSRHYPYIIIRRGIRLTLEDQSGHADDLATYVTSRLLIQEPALVERLQPKLFEKAAGVFMWVVLVVDILNTEYRRGGMALERRLAEIPSDLSELFKDILRRDSENMEALKLCILWVLFARIPLRLQEFYHALWSGLSLDGSADNKIPDVTVLGTGGASDMFKRYVISSSKGLAEATKSSEPTVQFIHESVRDFLIKDKGLYELWPELGLDCEGLGHEKLKHCCDLYANHTKVCTSVSQLLAEPKSDSKNEILQMYPFLEYATQNILHHANAAAKAAPQDDFLSSFRFYYWIRVSNIFEKFKNRRYTPTASLIYILADGGFPALIRARIKKDPRTDVFGERYKYPLFAALANGHKDAAAALLNSPSRICDGVDITEGLNFRRDLKDSANRTPLSWASQNGRVGIVKLLLQTRTACDESDSDGQTPLSLALAHGHATVARLLIERGADTNARDIISRLLRLETRYVNHETLAKLLIDTLKINFNVSAIDENGSTLLHTATTKGHRAIVRFLIEKDANINVRDMIGQTPLHKAIGNNYPLIAMLLIDIGADVNISDNFGQTPFDKAPKSDDMAMAKLLIENGFHLNAADKDGRTSLDRALEKDDTAMAELLIEKGANVNTVDRDSWTPLHRAIKLNNTAMAKLLIEKGAHLNTIDYCGRTPLRNALGMNDTAVAKLLVEKGADFNIDTNDENGWAPLQRALENNHIAMVIFLIEEGAHFNIDAHDANGRALLDRAVESGHAAIVELLIEKGAPLNAVDKDGRTILYRALENDHVVVSRFLIEKGARLNVDVIQEDYQTSLHRALEKNHAAIAKLLIEKGAVSNIDVGDEDGRTPLHKALESNHVAIAMFLIEKGAHFDIDTSDKESRILLQLALSNGHEAVVKHLISKGAEINDKDKDGWVPLRRALSNGHETVARLLLESGANVNVINGWNPLQWASSHGHLATVKLLIEHGADINAKDLYGSTALQWASTNGHEAVVNLLIENGAHAKRKN